MEYQKVWISTASARGFAFGLVQLTLLASLSQAQSTTTTGQSSISSVQSTAATSAPPSTLLTSTTSNASSSSSTSSTASAPSPTSTDSDSKTQDAETYYPAFIAVAVLLVLAGMWLTHSRRRRVKRQMFTGQQTALTQDLNGAHNGRRWRAGYWRSDTAAHREEGLDERGEAPPPYARNESRRPSADLGRVEVLGNPGGLAPPPIAHLRGSAFYKPPEYEETIAMTDLTSNASTDGSDVSRQNSTMDHNGHSRQNSGNRVDNNQDSHRSEQSARPS